MTSTNPSKPDITTIASGRELRKWYWRKDELIQLARSLGLTSNANKFELLEQIAIFLDTGEKLVKASKTTKSVSKFDWKHAPLTPTTIITDNYKNTQNVRAFFQSELGSQFKFNIAFMEWMRANIGLTLADVCQAYRTFKSQENEPGFQTKIKRHNQFNQYMRDILLDNPGLSLDMVRQIWAKKIQTPSEDGLHSYDPTDLKL